MAYDKDDGGAIDSGPTPDDVIDPDDLGGFEFDSDEDEADDEDDSDDSDDPEGEDDSDDSDDSEEEEDEDPEEDQTKEGKDYRELLAKYGGDKNAMARAAWDGARAASQLSKDNKDLKRGLEDLRDEIKDLKESQKAGGEKPPAELAEVAQDAKDLQDELQEHIKDQKDLLAEINEAQGELRELNGEIKATPLDKRAALVNRLKNDTEAYNRKVREYKAGVKAGLKIQRSLEKAQKRMEAVKETVEARKQDEKKQRAATKDAIEQEGKLFTALVNENFLTLQIPRQHYGDFYDTISAKVTARLRAAVSRGETDPMDLPALVADAALAEARKMGVKIPRGQTAAERKMESMKKLGRAGAIQRRPAAPTDRSDRSARRKDKLSKLNVHEQADYWKRRARGVVQNGPRRRPA